MQVKIGNRIHNSGTEPISIMFTDNEVDALARMMTKGHRIFNSFPKGMTEQEIADFNFDIAVKVGMQDKRQREKRTQEGT